MSSLEDSPGRLRRASFPVEIKSTGWNGRFEGCNNFISACDLYSIREVYRLSYHAFYALCEIIFGYTSCLSGGLLNPGKAAYWNVVRGLRRPALD